MSVLAVPKAKADFLLQRSGGIIVFSPKTEEAKAKVEEMGLEAWQRVNDGFAVELRFAEDLAGRLSTEDGFTFADA